MSVQNIQEYVRGIVDNMDNVPPKILQEMFGLIIEKVEIFPEEQPDGAWVKMISFKVPVVIDGETYTDITYHGLPVPGGAEIGPKVGSEQLLPNKRHVETVCLLTHTC